jgi:type I site-specific restriction endonuclease
MCKLDLTQYKDFFDVIIVDECHRVAGTPTAMTQFYKALNNLSARQKSVSRLRYTALME